MRSTLYRRTWMAKDITGCEFRCRAYYSPSERWYYADGLDIHARTLDDLKRKVYELTTRRTRG